MASLPLKIGIKTIKVNLHRAPSTESIARMPGETHDHGSSDSMILVTGASGFVGAAVVRALLARGEQVRVLVRSTSDHRNIEGLELEIVEGDLLIPETLSRAVDGCTGVYHLAADYRLWTRDPESMFRVNLEGSRAVVLAAMKAGVQRIVYTSSVAVLGIIPDGEGKEDTPVDYADMVGVYKQSKYRAEEAVRRLIIEERAPVVIVNPSTLDSYPGKRF